MEITEVKVRLRDREGSKLKAYATIIFDNSFVVRDLKVIDGRKGLFVAMPSRQVREACPGCHHRNALRSKFCNQCGKALEFQSAPRKEGEDRVDEHRDVAHPITSEVRDYLQNKVLGAYEAERATLPQEVKTETKPVVEQPPIAAEFGAEQPEVTLEQPIETESNVDQVEKVEITE